MDRAGEVEGLLDGPERIYLQPACCADPAVGRVWCDSDEPERCEEGVRWTPYVRADVHAAEMENHRTVAKRELVGPPEGCENPGTLDDGEQVMCAECPACLDYIADYWYRVANDMGEAELERKDEALREAREEEARCLCQWVGPLDGVIRQDWPAETDPRCPVHGRPSYRTHEVDEAFPDDDEEATHE